MRDKILSIENLMAIILILYKIIVDREFDGDHSDISRFSYIKSYGRKTRFDAFCTYVGNGWTVGAPVRLPISKVMAEKHVLTHFARYTVMDACRCYKIISIENLMAIILTYLDSLRSKVIGRKTRFDAFCTVYGNGMHW
uniref:Phage integrase family protein n=1 Tax=Heterorhabditis bacteriophora TaxID=37862 RepID=A0A1I7WKR4_HETBA